MKTINDGLKQFLTQEDGQSLIEYSLIASIVAIGAIGAMWAMKDQINALFNIVSAALRLTF